MLKSLSCLSLALTTVLAMSCGTNSDFLDSVPADVLDSKVIIGELDWQEIRELDAESEIAQQASFVASLTFRRLIRGARCTGFMISEDIMMTNHHCIKGQFNARALTASFRFQDGHRGGSGTVFQCREYLGSNKDLDYSLIRCDGRPGRVMGWAQVGEPVRRAGTHPLYVIHQNCDYYTKRNCEPTKKYSPGELWGYVGEQLGHSADTLGGSSGSPIFDAETHELIGIHVAGVGGDSRGRGTINVGVPIDLVLLDIRSRFPHLNVFPKR
jgi:hypothetical protein